MAAFLYIDVTGTDEVALYLLDAVFLPEWRTVGETRAWTAVLETLLMSGAFFFDLP